MGTSCLLYKIFIDPLLRSLRHSIARIVDDRHSSIIEIGSGTGAQSLLLASPSRRVLGVDLNEQMAVCAQRQADRNKAEDLTYMHADARDLSGFSDHEFQAGLISLALHEMDQNSRTRVLKELKRVSKTVYIADYRSPLPHSLAGGFVRLIERLAGADHYAGFLDYQNRGGLGGLFEKLNLKVISQSEAVASTIVIYTLVSSDDIPDSSSR
jgi:SAM-dependent methyltransferase